jgi:hypothetical protein
MKEKLYCRECNSYINKNIWYITHAPKHIQNDIKYKSDENIYENLLNY